MGLPGGATGDSKGRKPGLSEKFHPTISRPPLLSDLDILHHPSLDPESSEPCPQEEPPGKAPEGAPKSRVREGRGDCKQQAFKEGRRWPPSPLQALRAVNPSLSGFHLGQHSCGCDPGPAVSHAPARSSLPGPPARALSPVPGPQSASCWASDISAQMRE